MDGAIRHFNTCFHHGQAKPETTKFINVASTVKLSENHVQLVRRYPTPLIADREGNRLLGHADVQLDIATIGRLFQGITHEI